MENANLGLPMPADSKYIALVKTVGEIISVCAIPFDLDLLAIFEDSMLKDLLKKRSECVCSGPDWISLHSFSPKLERIYKTTSDCGLLNYHAIWRLLLEEAYL